MKWIITIECVGITFTHTLTFVLDIDNVDIEISRLFNNPNLSDGGASIAIPAY